MIVMKMGNTGIFILIASCFISFKAFSQRLPEDDTMLKGKLENGLSYYIKNNDNPENQVELRLVINTGSLYEEESEQGFAHFVEHMCFNGTKNFPGNEVIHYLETKGMRFGRHFNALTSFAETKYMLSLPNPDEELLHNGFQILEDWAHQVSFEDEEIEKERGVIIQEYRSSLGAETRLREQFYPAIFRGALYQYRLPIGKKEILESFHPDELREFYYKWYRPERMAVIVVGDIDNQKALSLVKKHFAHIKNEYPKSEVPLFDVSNNKEPVFKVCSDNEAGKELIRIYYIDDPGQLRTYEDLKKEVIHDLTKGMITRRFKEINQPAESPFIYSQPGIGYLVRTKDAFTFTGIAKPGRINDALNALLVENRRLSLHGLTQSELEVEKKILLKQVSTKVSEKEDSKEIANKLMDKYLKEDPATNAGFILNITSDIIKKVSLEDINENLFNWLEKYPVIVANIIDIDSVPEFKDNGVERIYNNILASSPEAYISTNPENLLTVDIELPGKVVNEEIMDSYGITKWILSNGAKVILKPTDFENDEILFASISKGGTSQYNDEDLVTAELSSKAAYMSGINGLSFSEIRSMMQMKGVRIGTWVNQYSEGSSGYSDGQGIEELLKMNYLYFQNLQADSAATAAYLSRIRSQLRSFKNEPNHVFSDTITKILYGSDSRRLALSNDENFERFDLQRANQIVKERFSDPSGFTFIFVGNIDPEHIKPLVEKYIGGMSGEVKNESLPEKEYFAIKENTDITVYSGKADKSMVDITYFGELPYSIKNRASAKVMTEVLKINLRKALREEKSGVYGISVSSDFSSIPVNHFKFDVFFQCASDLVETLINEVYLQIEIIKKEGPDQETLEKVKSVLSSEYDQNVRKNKYWQDQLTEIYGFDKDLDLELSDYMPAVMAVTASDVQKLCRKKLKKKNMLTAKMYPESNTQK